MHIPNAWCREKRGQRAEKNYSCLTFFDLATKNSRVSFIAHINSIHIYILDKGEQVGSEAETKQDPVGPSWA